MIFTQIFQKFFQNEQLLSFEQILIFEILKKKKFGKNIQHLVFPRGPPPQY